MKLNIKTKSYLAILFVYAIIIFLFLFYSYDIFDIKLLIFWASMSAFVESLLLPLPNNTVGVSVGYAVNIASIITGGPIIATIAASAGILFRIPKIIGRGYVHLLNSPPYKTLFNVSQSIIVIASMSLIYIYTGGGIGSFSLIPTVIIVLLGVILNTLLISIFLSLFTGDKFLNVWISNMRGIFPSAIAVGTMGIIVALAFIGYGYGAVILFFGPLLLARYSFKLYIEMRNLYLATIEMLNKTVEAKDPYTSGHASRVEELAVRLAEAYELPFQSIQNIRTASILHDIGKIGINDSILNKATRLSQDELLEIMKHPSIGAEIIEKVDFLKDITAIIKHHHERYDGKGYPDGLTGKDIPVEACILTIADSYDAMTSDRPYRKALTKAEALRELENNSGTQFHPQLVEMFISIMKE